MELKEYGSLTSDYAESCSNQDSMALGQKQECRSVERAGKPRNTPTLIVLMTMTKDAGICNGEKTVSFLSGAGKT